MRESPGVEVGFSHWEDSAQKVIVPDFCMGRCPVTNQEYGRFLKAAGYQKPRCWADNRYNQPRQPVVGVTWHDADKFAQWAGLHLPTEAEWEYACRAETTTFYYTGNFEDDLARAGWYVANSGQQLHAVGEKEPNAFGLYDMHGNVWEWIEDHFHKDYNGAPTDGSAWVNALEGAPRVLRGGGWSSFARSCRSAFRGWRFPVVQDRAIGFRLVLRQFSIAK
jgi:formylglycine-generating enzyme required for sulfatase activity